MNRLQMRIILGGAAYTYICIAECIIAMGTST